MADSHSHPCPEGLEQPLKGWLPFKLTSSAIKLLAEQDFACRIQRYHDPEAVGVFPSVI